MTATTVGTVQPTDAATNQPTELPTEGPTTVEPPAPRVPAPGLGRPLVATVTAKGGAGKTTSTVALADALQRHTGWRVLVVDTDPQATAGRWVTPGAADADVTLVEVLAGTASLQHAVRELRPGLSVVSGHDGLGDLEPDLADHALRERVLRESGVDVVLIDTPGARPLAPGANLLRQAVEVADLVVAPFGLHETDSLVEVIADVEAAVEALPGEADVVLLPTRVKPAVAEVVARVATAVGAPYPFLQAVRRADAVEAIVPTRRLLADHAPRNAATREYALAAEQLAEHLLATVTERNPR